MNTLPDVSGAADARGVTFALVDRRRRLAAVRLVQELGLPGPVPFERVTGGWMLRLDRPHGVDRMEYLLEIEDQNAHRWTITDPANLRRAPGAFGEKSVVEFDTYTPPAWLDSSDAVDAAVDEREFDVLGQTMHVTLWSPATLSDDAPAPLLAVHDGPEFDKLGGFTRYLAASIASGELPPVRAALLDPGDRNDWYAANPDYAGALCGVVLPALERPGPVVGVGVSLGALAMLHAHRRHPGTFDALFLQSGSFFTAELDGQESGFGGFAAVTEFVAATHAADRDVAVPAVLTCGTVEENLANNQAMAATLSRLGYGGALHEQPDAHNFTAWRDALHPHLTTLIGAVDAS